MASIGPLLCFPEPAAKRRPDRVFRARLALFQNSIQLKGDADVTGMASQGFGSARQVLNRSSHSCCIWVACRLLASGEARRAQAASTGRRGAPPGQDYRRKPVPRACWIDRFGHWGCKGGGCRLAASRPLGIERVPRPGAADRAAASKKQLGSNPTRGHQLIDPTDRLTPHPPSPHDPLQPPLPR